MPRTMTDPSAVQWTAEHEKGTNTSLPASHSCAGWIPKESLALLRKQLDIIYPDLAASKSRRYHSARSQIIPEPLACTRMCWYSDVVDGDWVIDYSPKYPSLFIATGGAGHAFKVGTSILCLIIRYNLIQSSCPSWVISSSLGWKDVSSRLGRNVGAQAECHFRLIQLELVCRESL